MCKIQPSQTTRRVRGREHTTKKPLKKGLSFSSRIFIFYRQPGAGRDLEGQKHDQNVEPPQTHKDPGSSPGRRAFNLNPSPFSVSPVSLLRFSLFFYRLEGRYGICPYGGFSRLRFSRLLSHLFRLSCALRPAYCALSPCFLSPCPVPCLAKSDPLL